MSNMYVLHYRVLAKCHHSARQRYVLPRRRDTNIQQDTVDASGEDRRPQEDIKERNIPNVL